MSRATRRGVLRQLGLGNSLRARGRLVILTLILAAALVTRATVTLVLVSLCREAVATVTCSGPLPEGFTSLAVEPHRVPAPEPPASAHPTVSFPDRSPSTESPDSSGSSSIRGSWQQAFGPTGYLELVRFYLGGAADGPERLWFSEITGRFPRQPSEVAIPKALAEWTGLGPGDILAFGEQLLTVTGVYVPLGVGPIYSYLLSMDDSPLAQEPNFMLVHRSGKTELHRLRLGGQIVSWRSSVTLGGQPVDLYERVSGATVAERTAALARDVYGAQGAAMNLGFALVGVAVFLILIIALHDRRRELASYKLAGVDAVGAASVLGVELALTCGLAVAVAGPVFWLVAAWRLVPAHPSVTPLLVGAFVVNLVWVTLTVALAALYPLLLAAVASPSQLLAGQKIFLFRRRRELRGWLE